MIASWLVSLTVGRRPPPTLRRWSESSRLTITKPHNRSHIPPHNHTFPHILTRAQSHTWPRQVSRGLTRWTGAPATWVQLPVSLGLLRTRTSWPQQLLRPPLSRSPPAFRHTVTTQRHNPRSSFTVNSSFRSSSGWPHGTLSFGMNKTRFSVICLFLIETLFVPSQVHNIVILSSRDFLSTLNCTSNFLP